MRPEGVVMVKNCACLLPISAFAWAGQDAHNPLTSLSGFE